MNPALINLLVFAFVVTGLWLAYRLYHGKNLLQSRVTKEKTLTEDILKQLYHVEQSQRKATLDSLAGALQIKRKVILAIINQMAQNQLVQLQDTQIELTPNGQQYALKIIRIHRLWEKYLAEQTGHQPSEWHDLAEKKEHEMTEEETLALASFLGNPLFDPHGDPIPNQSGQMNKVKWTPLPSYPVDQPGKITHIEDEPEVVYQQILAKRIFIGSQIKLLSTDNNSVRFICEGVEHEFSTIVAANIHIQALAPNEIFEEKAIRLSSLQAGESAEVLGLSIECRGANRRRLLDLGILPGTPIEVDLKSPLKDPVAYRVRNTSIALRSTLSDLILINKKTIHA
jgi:DtxR family Mn-dependent transcriptional regulator